MSAINQSGWRPEMGSGSEGTAPATFTGNKALMLEEPLLFEIGDVDRTGVDLPERPKVASRLAGLERNRPIGLPGLSEPEAVRHYPRLSRQNYAIDLGLFPLGSCTMKHNPRLNEKMARLPGFADLHPLTPVDGTQGALALIDLVATWLKALTGMPGIAMSPKAGARGEGGCAQRHPRPRKRARHQPRRRRLCGLCGGEHPCDRRGPRRPRRA